MDGYEVVGMTSSEEALRSVESDRFDAIVTDLEMPNVHGLDIVRAARTRDPAATVVVVTAYVNSPASRNAVALGAKAVLNKPLRYETLIQVLPIA
jgi:CheY-like chemotaxis protein